MKKVAGSRLEFLEYFILLITSPNPHMVMVELVVMVVVEVVEVVEMVVTIRLMDLPR